MTTDTLTPERAQALLRAYGTAPTQWPEADREALAQAIASDQGLQSLLAEERRLDERLAAYQPAARLTVAEITARVEQSIGSRASHPGGPVLAMERAVDWLCFSGLASLWRGGAAAVLTMAVGFSAGAVTPGPAVEEAWAASEQFIFIPFAEVAIDG